ENFVLPFSHDEVVHGKRAMLDKMPGDLWQKHASLRSLYGYMFAHPGKKLLFMGCEFGQWREWNYDTSLDWHLLEYAEHLGLQQWVHCCDNENSVMSFLRRAKNPDDFSLIVTNFTPVPRLDYRIGVPEGGWY